MRKTMISLRLSETQLEQIRAQAEIEHRSVTNMIEYMIDYYIIAQEHKPRKKPRELQENRR